MTKIGFVGCGSISGIYLENITNMFKEIEIAGVCDLIDERAENASKQYGVRKYGDMHELFADPEVGVVLNITRPYEHLDVTMAAIAAGKHVYSEKPLGATFEEGKKILEAAKAKGVVIGGAPDTFLGAGIQTCRKLIDDGYIGTIVGASAFMVSHGHETWHPDPEFYYKFGGGPMMDMGPYYITALVNLLGPVQSLTGMSRITFPNRLITSEPHNGTVVDVDVPTNIAGIMRFHSGAIGTIFTTFDVYRAKVPIIEVYGSEGTLSVPDPNYFGGPVGIFRPGKGDQDRNEFLEFPLCFDYCENNRALGLADMAKALETGRKPRAGSDLTSHVLEVITGFDKSSAEGRHIVLETKPERPAPMIKGRTGYID